MIKHIKEHEKNDNIKKICIKPLRKSGRATGKAPLLMKGTSSVKNKNKKQADIKLRYPLTIEKLNFIKTAFNV